MSDLHLNFLRLHPIQAKLIIFRVLTVRILLRIFKKIEFPLNMQAALTPPSIQNSLSLRIVWFATNILFILQDSLIRVSRRDEERKMLKELALVIVEHTRSARLIKGQYYCPPTVEPKAYHRAPIRAIDFLSAPKQFQAPRLQST
jgi:hypothetical protein